MHFVIKQAESKELLNGCTRDGKTNPNPRLRGEWAIRNKGENVMWVPLRLQTWAKTDRKEYMSPNQTSISSEEARMRWVNISTENTEIRGTCKLVETFRGAHGSQRGVVGGVGMDWRHCWKRPFGREYGSHFQFTHRTSPIVISGPSSVRVWLIPWACSLTNKSRSVYGIII